MDKEKAKAVLDIKRYVDIANEKRMNDPSHVIVSIVDSMIMAGLIDKKGNIINKPEDNAGKQK